MAQNEQISITLSFKKDDTALIQVQQQVNGFLTTLQKGLTLGIGMNLANSLLSIPRHIRAAIVAGEEYARTVRNMAIETRQTAEQFQVTSLLATQYGVQINLLTTAVQKMNTGAEQAVDGNTKMADAFQRLGINAREFSGLNTPDQLQSLANAAAKAGWSTQALNDIAQILGRRAAPQLMAVLHALADEGFGAISKAAIDAGAVLSGQLADDVANVGNEWKATGQIWKVTSAEFVEYLKPILDALDWIANKVALVVQRILLGSQLLAADIKALMQTFGQLNRTKDPNFDFGKKLGDNIDIAGANVNAKWTPQTGGKGGGPISADGAAAAKKTATEVGRLTAELETFKQRADEAAMSAGGKMVDLAERVAKANKAIMDYGRSHSGDLSKDPEMLKLEVARERLQVEFETAQKESERAAKAAQAASERAAHAAKSKADQEQHAASLAAEIPLQDRLRDIEKERALITANHLLDSVTKQQRLNDNAAEYRKIIAAIVEIERQRFATAKDPLEVARLKSEIARLQSESKHFGVREQPVTKEQQSDANAASLSDPTRHLQSPAAGLRTGLQDFATSMGTVADQIHGHVISIAHGLQSGIGNALLGLEQRTMSWGNAFRSVANGLVTSLLTAGNQMIVAWVFGETARTAATTAGTSARVGILSGETAAHIVHNVIRFTIHAATEVGKTAVTILNAGSRIGSIITESLAYVAQAAVGALSAMASIPYVGPFLAIGAMAAILAAGYGIVKGVSKGFRKGGYTGDGPPDGEAGVVHYGEGVLHAGAMRLPGAFDAMASLNAGDTFGAMAALADATTGRLAARAGSPGAGGLAGAKAAASSKNMSVSFLDDRQAAIREMRKQSGQKQLIQMARNNRGQFFV